MRCGDASPVCVLPSPVVSTRPSRDPSHGIARRVEPAALRDGDDVRHRRLSRLATGCGARDRQRDGGDRAARRGDERFQGRQRPVEAGARRARRSRGRRSSLYDVIERVADVLAPYRWRVRRHDRAAVEDVEKVGGRGPTAVCRRNRAGAPVCGLRAASISSRRTASVSVPIASRSISVASARDTPWTGRWRCSKRPGSGTR